MDKLIIGIPTINRADLLQESLEDISDNMGSDVDRLIIVDNGGQDITIPENLQSNTNVITPGRNQGVAGSWNLIARMAFNAYNAKQVLILNDDIVLGKTRKDIEEVLSDYNKYGMICGNNHLCAFLFSRAAWNVVGEFDKEFYPAYFEDNDYIYRMGLKGFGCLPDDRMDPEAYRNSMTIEKDPDLNEPFDENKQRYIDKWGGEPGEEKYKTPFNRK